MEKEYWYILFSGILFGGLVFGGQIFINLGLSVYEVSLIPHLFSLAFLLIFIFLKKRFVFSKGMIKFFFIFGLFNAINEISQFSALVFKIPVVIVGFLLYTQPLWTIIISKIFLKEKITRYKLFAMVLVLVGIFILVNPLNKLNNLSLYGIFIGLIAGISLSGWVVYSRKAGIKKYNTTTTTFGFYASTIFLVLLIYPLLIILTKNPSIIRLSLNLPLKTWIYLAIFAFVAGLMPHILLFRGSQKVSASTSGIILLLEPISAAVLATIFLQQPITLNILLGGALILISNYIVIHKK